MRKKLKIKSTQIWIAVRYAKSDFSGQTGFLWCLHRPSHCNYVIDLNCPQNDYIEHRRWEFLSVLLYKDLKFEDIRTTIPFLTLEDNIFVKINLVCYIINSFFKYFRGEGWKIGTDVKQLPPPSCFTMNIRELSLIFSQHQHLIKERELNDVTKEWFQLLGTVFF